MDRQERVRLNNRGQFSIIAAMFVAVILVGTLMAVYSTIRYDSSQNQSPQVLTATDETDSAILKALGFTVGYYGSILQVTGNSTYAKANATAYMNSALQYISTMNPSWGTVLNMTSLNLSTNWFTNSSISTGQVSVIYNLAGLGLYGINYASSCSLRVQIFNSPSPNQICLNVTQDDTQPQMSLGQQNFNFYSYRYSDMTWQLIPPNVTPLVFTNGTYIINTPTGMNSSAYVIQVTDPRGIMVIASSFNSYNISFATSSSLQISPLTVELLQNGTVRWLGQNLQNSTMTQPIPPIPVKAFHISPYGTHLDLPYQIEDWASQYQIPLGLTNNYTLFGNNQMIVFQVSAAVPQVTLWWNGSDTATQPPSGFTDTCFVSDNPGGGTLTNGNTTIQISYPNGQFQINSTTGGVTSLTTFMRVNVNNSTYGSGSPAYVIHHGVVRDIVQEEAEWSNGITNCPNVYSQIVLTLPANSTYFTYQGRLMFINSAVSRSISDLSPIQLTTTIAHPQVMTENGTSGGLPLVSNSSGVFYNYGFSNGTWTAHHWSQLINNSTGQGTGIMFTDAANRQLFAFDSMAGKQTGGLYANASSSLIEIDPVTSQGPVSFTSPLDLSWFGAVATFTNQLPIYTNSSGTPTGLWPLVEQPPAVIVTPVNTDPSVILSPNTGTVGTSVTVSGSGFYPNSTIIITYDGTTMATTVANASGFITSGAMFNVPASAAGSSHAVTATDMLADTASASFTVDPFISLSPVAGNVGSTITVTGSGFNANSTIALSFSGLNPITSPTSIVSSSTGGFSATFSVPASAAGINVVQATDGINNSTAIFNVTSSISLNPQVGGVGSDVSVSGSGFASNSSITIKFDGANQSTSPAIVKTRSDGSFSATFVVPASAVGNHIVASVDASSDTASANFTSVPASITLMPTSGLQGASVTVSGSNFLPNSTATMTFAGNVVSTSPSPLIVSGAGSFSASFTVPSGSSGAKTVTATDSSSNSASATYTVTVPTVSLNPSNGSVGTTITVSGSSFWPNSVLTIAYDGTTVATTNSTSSGAVPSGVTFTIPASVYGGHTVRIVDANGNAATATFSVAASINLTPVAGTVGTTITISGQGFAANSTITAKFNGATVATSPPTVATDGSGSFPNVTFTVPSSSSGSKPVQAMDSMSNAASGTFTVNPVTEIVTITPTNGYSSSDAVTVSGAGASVSTIPIDGQPHNFTADPAATITFTVPTDGSSSRYRFNNAGASSTTWSYTTASSGIDTKANTVYYQLNVSFAYATNDGTKLNSQSNLVAYTQLGGMLHLSTNGSGTLSLSSDWADSGTSVTYVSPVTISGSERYMTTSGDSGAITVISSVNASNRAANPSYYHQYTITFGYGDQDSSAVTSGSQIGSYYQFGSSIAINSGSSYGATSPASAWVDAGSAKVSYQTFTAGSGTERWALSSSPATFNVSSSVTISDTNFYHQYSETLSFSVTSGSGYGSPAFIANRFGSSAPQTLTTSATGYWFDAGASWIVSSTLNGAPSNFRWAIQTTSGTLPSSFTWTSVFTYYRQVSNTFSVAFTGGNPGTGDTLVLTGRLFGASGATILTLNVGGVSSASNAAWSDCNYAVTFPVTTTNSGTSERWAISSVYSTPTLTAGGSTYSPTSNYYHQYSFQLDYALSLGGTGYSAPTLTAMQFGLSYTPTVTTTYVTYWLDNGQSWGVTNPLSGSGSGERWYSSQTVSGTVSSSSPTTAGSTLTFTYNHQYYFQVSSAYDSATGTGWYNAGATTVSSSVTRPVTVSGVTYDTTGWTGTGSLSSGGTFGSSTTGVFTINSYTTCTWSWKAVITRVQAAPRGTSTSASISVTLGSAPTSGHVLIAVIGTYRTSSSTSRTVSSITETGVTWTRQTSQSDTSGSDARNVEIWLGIVSSGASTSISITLSGTPAGAVADVCEYSGIATSSSLDRTTGTYGQSTSTSTGTTSTTTQNSELWIGGIVVEGNNAQTSPTNGFTNLDGATFNSAMSLSYLEKIVSATGAANSGTTISNSRYWTGCIATFKGA